MELACASRVIHLISHANEQHLRLPLSVVYSQKHWVAMITEDQRRVPACPGDRSRKRQRATISVMALTTFVNAGHKMQDLTPVILRCR